MVLNTSTIMEHMLDTNESGESLDNAAHGDPQECGTNKAHFVIFAFMCPMGDTIQTHCRYQEWPVHTLQICAMNGKHGSNVAYYINAKLLMHQMIYLRHHLGHRAFSSFA